MPNTKRQSDGDDVEEEDNGQYPYYEACLDIFRILLARNK